MALYISNSTRQHWVFNYQEPVNRLRNFVDIPSGGQNVIGHNWTAEQTARVIEQLEFYGAHNAAEAHGRGLDEFTGLLYRHAGVVSEDEIMTGHDAVNETLNNRSVEQAVNGALAFDRSINQGSRGARRAQTTAVDVEQVPDPRLPKTGNEVRFSLEVDPVQGRSDMKLPKRV